MESIIDAFDELRPRLDQAIADGARIPLEQVQLTAAAAAAQQDHVLHRQLLGARPA